MRNFEPIFIVSQEESESQRYVFRICTPAVVLDARKESSRFPLFFQNHRDSSRILKRLDFRGSRVTGRLWSAFIRIAGHICVNRTLIAERGIARTRKG